MSDLVNEGQALMSRGERAEPPLRMIQWAGAAQSPELRWQHQSLHSVAMRPPTIPKFSDVTASLPGVNGQVRRLEKSRHSKKDRLGVVALLAKKAQRQSLSEKSKGQLVLLVTKGRGDFLKERFVASVIFHDALDPRGFALQAELRGGREDAAEPFFRQILQRRLATARPRQRAHSRKTSPATFSDRLALAARCDSISCG